MTAIAIPLSLLLFLISSNSLQMHRIYAITQSSKKLSVLTRTNRLFSVVNTAKSRLFASSITQESSKTQTQGLSDEAIFGFDLPTNDNSPNLLRIRHTSAHVMAMAVQKLFPDAQVTIGPWVENG